MLELKKVYKSYETNGTEQNIVENVSLTFREREFVVILGPAGAGKSALLRLIAGLESPDHGTIRIDGKDTGQYTEKDWDEQRKTRISYLAQECTLIREATVIENVELALWASGISGEECRKKAAKSLEAVGMQRYRFKKPFQLSSGQCRKAEVARTLAKDSRILLADEPAGMLDSESAYQIMELLREASKTRLVIAVIHQTELAEEYASRIIRMVSGSVLDDSRPYSGRRDNNSRPYSGRRDNDGRGSHAGMKNEIRGIRSLAENIRAEGGYMWGNKREIILDVTAWSLMIAGVSSAVMAGGIKTAVILSAILTVLTGILTYLLRMRRAGTNEVLRSMGMSKRKLAVLAGGETLLTGGAAAICGAALSMAATGTPGQMWSFAVAGAGGILHVILNLLFLQKECCGGDAWSRKNDLQRGRYR